MMAERAESRMGVEAFLEWAERQEGRWELVDGFPYAMARATRGHDRIVANAIGSLVSQLVGKPCEVFTADTAVVTLGGNVRLPDLGVDCGEADDSERRAMDPRLVVEVLSPSTRGFDMFVKVDEYKALPSLTYILLLSPEEPLAQLWSRETKPEWTHKTVEGLDAVVNLPALELSLPMRVLYDRVHLLPKPRLIE